MGYRHGLGFRVITMTITFVTIVVTILITIVIPLFFFLLAW